MTLKNLDELETNKRKEQKIKEVTNKLREVNGLSIIKDLTSEVQIANYNRGGSSYHYGILYLTKEGLKEKTGYHDSCWDSLLSDSYEREQKKVELNEFERIVKEYSLSVEDIKELESKLISLK